MSFILPLHLFYEEPDPDRWVRGDRHLRRLIRRIFRGKPRPGGVMRWFLNLQAGLDRLGVPYLLNDYRSLLRNPGAVAYVVGKPHVVDKIPSGHPIIYGPGIAAHPLENEFWDRAQIKLILVSCKWFKEMYDRDLPRFIPTCVWPAGIDTELWSPPQHRPQGKILVYDKIRWRREHYEPTLIDPIIDLLRLRGMEVIVLRYGHYLEDDYHKLLHEVSSMVFLCEHETQGFAYLQALACDVPILAWDRGGYWQDPAMYPDRVLFEPVTSVPYFDQKCGMRFFDFGDFAEVIESFLSDVRSNAFRPRGYVLDNFDLAQCAEAYLALAKESLAET